MSVAFRRESDEEHLEPRFELPIPPGPNPVTARGLAMIAARVDALEAAVAAESADDARKALQRDLRYWRQRLATAERVPAPDGDTVAFGSRVTLSQHGTTRTLDLVGHDESDPASGRIAFSAPVARALIGADVGEEVDLPNGPAIVTAIAPIPEEAA